MEIEYINELQLNQGCTDEKIHVTPHIGLPYSPVSCDYWNFIFVVVWETFHSSSWRL